MIVSNIFILSVLNALALTFAAVLLPKKSLHVADVPSFAFSDSDFQATQEVPFQLTDYNLQLQPNKQNIVNIMTGLGVNTQDQMLLIAFAMIETLV